MACDKLRPIEEAPRDGTVVLAYFEGREGRHRCCTMYWEEKAHLWYTNYGRTFLGPPTAWLPLPDDEG